jgi:predicted ABC-type ATPase
MRIREIERLDETAANLAAVQRIEAWLEASIFAHQTIGVETVLSTSKYQRLALKAKELGFQIHLIYVLLDSVERNIERVRIRARKGGHGVPEDKLRSRYARSLEQLPWYLDKADRAWLYDNSAAAPKLVGEKIGGTIRIQQNTIPALLDAARKIALE